MNEWNQSIVLGNVIRHQGVESKYANRKANTIPIYARYMHTHLILRIFPKQEHQRPWLGVVGFILTFPFLQGKLH